MVRLCALSDILITANFFVACLRGRELHAGRSGSIASRGSTRRLSGVKQREGGGLGSYALGKAKIFGSISPALPRWHSAKAHRLAGSSGPT